ncbi:MAG: SCO family protein [Armatimonadetes bacterium]|nr:SCO family protein [Armatimonadota bacterium]
MIFLVRPFLVFCAAVVVAGAWAQNMAGAPRPEIIDNAQVVKQIGIDDKRGAVIPLATKFKDEEGRDVILRDYIKDKPVLLMPIFYNCQSACTLVFNGVMDCVKNFEKPQLGKDFDIVVVGINPQETPIDAKLKRREVMKALEAMRKLGPNREAEQGWHFLTGTEENIHKVTDTIGFRYFYDWKKNQVTHPAGVMIITPDGVVSRYFYGAEYTPKVVATALAEAGKNRIGPKAQTILLGCLAYDPTRSKYVLVVDRTIKVVGTSFAVLVFASLAYMSMRYRYQAIPKKPRGKAE